MMSSWSRRTNQVWAMGSRGRLAACFLDSLATLEIPALGCGIPTVVSLISLRDGWQAEQPDRWLLLATWEVPAPLYGRIRGTHRSLQRRAGPLSGSLVPTGQWWAHLPMMPGYNNNTVNKLRLWRCPGQQSSTFRYSTRATTPRCGRQNFSENISRGSLSQRQRSRTVRLQQGVLLLLVPSMTLSAFAKPR